MSPGEKRLILASSSPRRQELLCDGGYRFAVCEPPAVREELAGHAPSPGAYVESLAYLKAVAAADAHGLQDELVLGADTAVELDGHILGKPTDEADARRILGRLAGSTHRVLTGLALVDLETIERHLSHAVTVIRMRPMSGEEIAAYVASGEAMGKAGAYAIQETGDRYVESVEGSFTNVVGLPMELLERLLEAAGHGASAFRDPA